VSFFSYYAAAAGWAWDTIWTFAADKLRWGVPVAAATAGMTAMGGAWLIGAKWRPTLFVGLLGAIGGPAIVVLCGFLWSLISFPPLHEANLDSFHQRISALERRVSEFATSAQPDPRVNAIVGRIAALEKTQEVVDAMAKFAWLADRQSELKVVINNYNSACNRLIEYYQHNINNNINRSFHFQEQIVIFERNLRAILKRDLSEDLNLSLHPNFDKNPLDPAPGEENIKSERDKGEYRRYYDQCTTAKSVIEVAEQKYTDAIDRYRARILNFGSTLPINK